MLIGKATQQALHLHKWQMIGWEKLMIKWLGPVLLDFSAAFDIIDQSLLLEKLVLWLYTPCYNVDKELLVLIEAYRISSS